MTNADAMWFLIGALTLLAAYRVWERGAVRRLRSHVQRLHDDRREDSIDIELLREEAVSLRERLELALVDLTRCERKLARARTGRARWQSLADSYQRMYRLEIKRADQAEARLMRWQYNARTGASSTGSNGQPSTFGSVLVGGGGSGSVDIKVAGGELRPEQVKALREGLEAEGLTRP